MHRVWALVILVALLPGCVSRGVLAVLPEGTSPAMVQRVFVATNRNASEKDGLRIFSQHFGETRSEVVRYAHIDVSIPPIHQKGNIEWARSHLPDPQQHFVVTDTQPYAAPNSFVQAIDAAMPPNEDTVVLFIHGYNVNNAEAVFRLAQIAEDFDASGPVVAFSWPSAGNPRGYVYDRDSVIFSRDALESVLVTLTSSRHKVLVVAHSMGTQLVMETLRQMSIAGKTDALRALDGVALISPDIDEDVFIKQAERIDPFPDPFLLITSRSDRALNIAAWLTGKPARLGSIADATVLEDIPVEVIDLSEVRGGDRIGHATAFTAPAAIELLRGVAQSGGRATPVN